MTQTIIHQDTKTLSNIKSDMSVLYEQVRCGTTDLKTAAELANITGKFLKAAQLEFAQEVFAARLIKTIEIDNA